MLAPGRLLGQRQRRHHEVAVVEALCRRAFQHLDGGGPRRPQVELLTLGDTDPVADDHPVGCRGHRFALLVLIADRGLQIGVQCRRVLAHAEQ